jgi:DEAD/DEAH box helicase domain-containing protein
LIRRLKRITEFYGSNPIFVMTSATIGNPQELAERLIEDKVSVIENDGSPKGNRNFLIYNPPLINRDLGIREGVLSATIGISTLLLQNGIQTLVFGQSRRFIELVVRSLRNANPKFKDQIRGYRSGYLRRDRREIELGLKNGSILLAAATNALELGVDIGGVDVVLLAGYPGSISSMKQRAGRAGRTNNSSLSIMIASMNPLDQFLARNPEYLINKPIEQALIDPDNPLILLPHMTNAAFELPFREHENFGHLNWEMVEEYLDYLVSDSVLYEKSGKYYWLKDNYPAKDFSIRNAAPNTIILVVKTEEGNTTIGQVDFNSGLWMVHKGAIYVHDGNSYHVDELDLEQNVAYLSIYNGDTVSKPIIGSEVELIEVLKNESKANFTNNFGEIVVKTQVEGYQIIQYPSGEIINTESVESPQTRLLTKGSWIVLSDECIETMKNEKMWLSEPNDYGPEWKKIREKILLRDNYRCQSCGKSTGELHIHHKIPFKNFINTEIANTEENLITLCPECHKLAELNVRLRSGISGLGYILLNLSPLFALCDTRDLGLYVDPAAKFVNNKPVIMLYDTIAGGIGLSEVIYRRMKDLIYRGIEVVSNCDCQDGCPSCVGAIAENGSGGKKETLFLMQLLVGE